jgi:hypothetical protein
MKNLNLNSEEILYWGEKMSDKRLSGIILIIIGGLMAIGTYALLTYVQFQINYVAGGFHYSSPIYPYQWAGYILLLPSIALLIIGFVLIIYKPQNSSV